MKQFTIIPVILGLLLAFAACGKDEQVTQEPKHQTVDVNPAMCNMDSMIAVGARLVMSQEDTALFFGIADCITDTPSTPFENAVLELGKGNYDLAENSFAELFSRAADVPAVKSRLMFYRGIVLYLKADTSGAIEAFDSSLAYYPTAPEVLASRGIAKLDLGLYSKAVDDFDSAIEINHDFSEAWYQRGIAYYMMGQYKWTFINFDSALIFQPEMLKARYNKAVILHRLGRLDEAMANFDTVLTVKHDDYMAWIGKGLIFNRWEDNDEALACFDSSLAYKRDNVEAWNNKAATLGVMKRFDEAMACIDSSLAYEPDNERTAQLLDLIMGEQEKANE